MTDRELLELAAKAVRADVWTDCDGNFYCAHPADESIHSEMAWNPLIDDGDALRLAVKLNINVFIYAEETSTAQGGVVAKNWGSKEANTRRAIVRTAAEMGSGMP